MEKQQQIHDDSIERVKWAVQYLKDLEGDHTRISAKKIAVISGLSRAVLYKSHLRPLWDRTWNKLEKELKIRHNTDQQLREQKKLEDQIILLEQQLQKKEHQKARLLNVLEKVNHVPAYIVRIMKNLKKDKLNFFTIICTSFEGYIFHGIDTDEFDEKKILLSSHNMLIKS